MGLIIGMDEAGYGPNLGPLVITATAWKVPGDPQEIDLWRLFGEIVDQDRPSEDKLHIADSKQVYSPAKGIESLERSVHSLIGLNGDSTTSLSSLLRQVLTEGIAETDAGPWLQGRDLPLPQRAAAEAIAAFTDRWRTVCGDANVELLRVVSDVVLPSRFNRLLNEHGSKGVLLSKLSMRLLSRVVDFDGDEPVLVIGDKHGGRNRYDELLEEIAGDHFIIRETESRAASSYKVGSARVRFQTRAEEHLPVASSSLVCKYLREIMMELFNDYWREQIPDLKPTKGYPVDARRFRDEIHEKQQELGVPDAMLWRER